MRGNDPKKFTDNNHLGVPKTLDRKKLHRRSPYSAWDIWLIGLFSIGIGVVLTYTALFGENGFIKNYKQNNCAYNINLSINHIIIIIIACTSQHRIENRRYYYETTR